MQSKGVETRDNREESGDKGEEMGFEIPAHGGEAVARRKDVEEILLIEDDLDFVQDLLASWEAPCHLSVVSSGKEAFEYLQAFSPALVLLDLSLPHYLAATDAMEGLEILSYIRRHVASQLPIVVISREASSEAKACALRSGAQEYLEKPFDLARLDECVARLMMKK
jgi:DNA-binding response OmpR family regulator